MQLARHQPLPSAPSLPVQSMLVPVPVPVPVLVLVLARARVPSVQSSVQRSV